MKQKNKDSIKLIETNTFEGEYEGWSSMPSYPETIEENALKLLGDDLKIAVKKIAEDENIQMPSNYRIPNFMF